MYNKFQLSKLKLNVELTKIRMISECIFSIGFCVISEQPAENLTCKNHHNYSLTVSYASNNWFLTFFLARFLLENEYICQINFCITHKNYS